MLTTEIHLHRNLMHDFEALVRRDYWLVGVWLATQVCVIDIFLDSRSTSIILNHQAACDVLIAVIMTILLRRIRPGFRQ